MRTIRGAPVAGAGGVAERYVEDAGEDVSPYSPCERRRSQADALVLGLVTKMVSNRTACGMDEGDLTALPESHLKRNLVLERVSELVDSVDEVHADRLRFAAIKRHQGGLHSWSFIQPGDHDLAAKHHACEHITMDYDEENPPPPELERECSVAQRLYWDNQVGAGLSQLWEDNPRQASLRVSRMELPGVLSQPIQAAWSALQAQIEVARRSCGWANE